MSPSPAIAEAAPFPLELIIAPPRVLTSREELSLLEAAVSKNPHSRELRISLANLLHVGDHHERAIALLEQWQIPDFRAAALHALALLTRETPEADREVQRLSLRALELSQTDAERAEALTHLAKASIRLGETEKAREALLRALSLNRHDKDAYKRTVALDLHAAEPGRVVDLAQSTIAAGVLHSRVLASFSLALSSLGMVAEAREAQGLDRFLLTTEPPPPAGWNSLADFNQALAAELQTHPDLRFNRYGTASRQTWRIDQPSLQRSSVFPALQQLIRQEVLRYAAALPATGHPFLDARPARATLRNWCVLTEGDGHETWHVHQNGWLSGTYYVQVPDHIANGSGRDGCIAFGLPEETVGAENAQQFGETLVRPRAGLMTIFPSHTFHRTYPHGGSGRRICYAFDIIPKANAGDEP